VTLTRKSALRLAFLLGGGTEIPGGAEAWDAPAKPAVGGDVVWMLSSCQWPALWTCMHHTRDGELLLDLRSIVLVRVSVFISFVH